MKREKALGAFMGTLLILSLLSTVFGPNLARSEMPAAPGLWSGPIKLHSRRAHKKIVKPKAQPKRLIWPKNHDKFKPNGG